MELLEYEGGWGGGGVGQSKTWSTYSRQIQSCISADNGQWHLNIYQTGWSRARWYTARYLFSRVEPGSQSAFNSNTDISLGEKQRPNTLIWHKGEREECESFTCSLLNRKWPLCPKAFVRYYTQHLTFQKSISPWYSTEAQTTAFNRQHDITANGTQKNVHGNVITRVEASTSMTSVLYGPDKNRATMWTR